MSGVPVRDAIFREKGIYPALTTPEAEFDSSRDEITQIAIRCIDQALGTGGAVVVNADASAAMIWDLKFFNVFGREQYGMSPPWPLAWIEWEMADDDGTTNSAVLIDAVPVDGGGHAVTMLGPVWLRFGTAVGPYGCAQVFIDEHGAVGEPQYFLYALGLNTPAAVSFTCGDDYPDYNPVGGVELALRIVLNTFRLANCRNIDLVERWPSRHEQRAARRSGQLMNTWHELVITPTRQLSVGKDGKQQPVKGLVRQHICRGHFKTYTEDRPLFGKYAGTFWVPATVKGNPERGVVGKDYRIGRLEPNQNAA